MNKKPRNPGKLDVKLPKDTITLEEFKRRREKENENEKEPVHWVRTNSTTTTKG